VPVLAELVVAAAQLGEEHWTAGPLAELDAVLDAVGRPALWDGPLAWGRLQAALVTGDLDAARELAAGLAAATGTPPHGAGPVRGRRGLDGGARRDPDPADLAVTARRMAAAGLGREAAQLAGAAAAAVPDRRAAHQLHALARALGDDGAPGGDRGPGAAPDGSEADADGPAPAEPDAAPAAGAAPLTEREKEIGRLLLEGLTYKQVGARLYLSAKTVEHYVARLRQRLGATSRDELFALLRAGIR
jgi:DNA-binding CsgD family transcriptional regulator